MGTRCYDCGEKTGRCYDCGGAGCSTGAPLDELYEAIDAPTEIDAAAVEQLRAMPPVTAVMWAADGAPAPSQP